MKVIGYLLFAGFYYLFRIFCPIERRKVFCIMTHDSSKDGNVGAMVEYLKKQEEGYSFHYLRKAERNIAQDVRAGKGKLSFFIAKPYHLATSEYILMDNVFLPMSFMKFSRRVRVIQLWHGTGTIKKFGQDVNTGLLKRLERMANARITHLIVNSDKTKKQYAGAFGIPEDRIYIYGLPRTSLFFDPDRIEDRRQRFYRQFPELKSKRLVLYAPTFRDQEYQHPKLELDMELLRKQLPEDIVILLRLHPFVAAAYRKENAAGDTGEGDQRILSMSSYQDISTLLLVSDYLITDYSSVIFDYCLLQRPMIFYAYDLESFKGQGRGFYDEAYEEYVPGPVVRDTQGILDLLVEDRFDLDRIINFKKQNYRYLDNNAAERLYLHIFRQEG